MWPYIALTAATMVAIPASAIGYGYLRPVRKTRAPAFFIISRILRMRRGRRSAAFLLKHGWLRDLREPQEHDVSAILLGLGLRTPELRQIQGIYAGLVPEMGKFMAVATCVEIVRNLRANGK